MPPQPPAGFVPFKEGGVPPPPEGFVPVDLKDSPASNPDNPFLGGIIGRNDFSGFNIPAIKEGLGQNIGPIVGGGIGAAIGPWGVPLGIVAGKALQTGVQQAGSVLGSGVPVKSASEAGQDIASILPMAAVASPVMPLGAGAGLGAKALRAAYLGAGTQMGTSLVSGKSFGESAKEGFNTGASFGAAEGALGLGQSGIKAGGQALKRGIETFSGIAEPWLNRAIERTNQVLSKAGLDPTAIPLAANEVKQTLNAYAKSASEFYDSKIQEMLGSNNQKFNFFDKVKASLDKELNVLTDPQNPYGKDIIKQLEPIYNDASKLTDASAKQIYFFQKNLNKVLGEQINNAGQYTPLGAILAPLHNETKQFLSTNVPQIAQANARYAATHGLLDELGKVQSAEDLGSIISRAYNKNTKTMLSLEDAKSKIPGFKDMLDNFLDTLAGSKFDTTFGSQPRTGLIGGLAGQLGAAGAFAASGNFLPAAGLIGSAATQAALSSPRLVAEGIRAYKALTPIAKSIAPAGELGKVSIGNLGSMFLKEPQKIPF